MDAILIAVTGLDPKGWEERLRALAPRRDIRLWPECLGDPADIAYACAWQAPPGLLAGLLGIGGGIVIVPVIIELHRQQGMDLASATLFAIGTSQAAMVAASLLAALAHRRGLGIDRAVLRAWMPPVLAGAIAGVVVAPLLPTALLILSFVLIALALSVQLGTGGRWICNAQASWVSTTQAPGGPVIACGARVSSLRSVLSGTSKIESSSTSRSPIVR